MIALVFMTTNWPNTKCGRVACKLWKRCVRVISCVLKRRGRREEEEEEEEEAPSVQSKKTRTPHDDVGKKGDKDHCHSEIIVRKKGVTKKKKKHKLVATNTAL